MSRLQLLSRVMVALSCCSWACFFCLTDHYDQTRPMTMDEASGRVYALNSHGHIVYMNGREAFLLYASVSFGLAFFLSAFLADRKLKRVLASSESSR